MSGIAEDRSTLGIGIALMTSLLLSIFVFVLCLSLLSIASNDNFFTTAQERSMRAEFAATSGLELYRVSSETFTPGTPVTGTIPPPAGSSYVQNYSVQVLANGDVRATGILLDGTTTLAVRTIVVPQGDFALKYMVSGP